MDERHRGDLAPFIVEASAATGEAIHTCDVFAFGDSAEMADALAALVVAGRKRATAGLLATYEATGEPMPRPGFFSVVLDGRGRPAALIRTSEVSVVRFGEVGDAFAHAEGEGDGSLDSWRDAHRDFFARQGQTVDDDALVVCERFELVYAPSEHAPDRGGTR